MWSTSTTEPLGLHEQKYFSPPSKAKLPKDGTITFLPETRNEASMTGSRRNRVFFMSSRTSFQPPSQWNKTILSSTEEVQSEKVEKLDCGPDASYMQLDV